jgi:hypothetical protein
MPIFIYFYLDSQGGKGTKGANGGKVQKIAYRSASILRGYGRGIGALGTTGWNLQGFTGFMVSV